MTMLAGSPPVACLLHVRGTAGPPLAALPGGGTISVQPSSPVHPSSRHSQPGEWMFSVHQSGHRRSRCHSSPALRLRRRRNDLTNLRSKDCPTAECYRRAFPRRRKVHSDLSWRPSSSLELRRSTPRTTAPGRGESTPGATTTPRDHKLTRIICWRASGSSGKRRALRRTLTRIIYWRASGSSGNRRGRGQTTPTPARRQLGSVRSVDV